MNYDYLSTNEKVAILRKIATSLKGKSLTIPENDEGIRHGYHDAENILYFLADMLEE